MADQLLSVAFLALSNNTLTEISSDFLRVLSLQDMARQKIRKEDDKKILKILMP